MDEPIDIRAHHLLCIPRFRGRGYDQAFVANMKKVCQHIQKNPDSRINIIVGKTDVLCMNCPHRKGNECAQSEEIGRWVVEQDEKVAKLLGLGKNSIHSARDVIDLSLKEISETKIATFCKGCTFLEYCTKVGINKAFREELNRRSSI